ncbi:serine--tRNA ligase [Candidatus Bathyarchaeota archaeon]|nr:MAG: serine--tRNA ligase [Candidatus Bathyarchaeota archaeon]
MWSILYLLRNNPEKLRWSQKRRGLDESIIDKALKYDTAWRKSLKQLNDLRHKHNLISREIPKLKGVEREEKIKEAKRIEKEISTLEEEVKRLEMEREKLLRSIPNVVHEDVPIGESDLDNVPIRFYGKHRVWKGHLDAFLKQTEGFKVDYEVIDWKPVGHADAIEMLGLGDTLRAAKVAGSRFYYLFEDLVWLDLALLLYALDHMAKLGFKPCIPPYMLRRTPYEGVITLGDFEDAIYKIEGEDLYLIATSEHPMAALYMGEAIEEDQLPILLTGISPCFRKEAGTRGKDTKGIFRVHQFHKVEQFVFCMPEESWKWHEKLIKNAEELWRKLEIPHRVVNICTGDLGAVAAKKYDLEAWMPAQGRYREMVSCSNCTDWQSYRLKIRYVKKGGAERDYVHTLNSTAIASTRAITAILENFQEPDGTIIIPKALKSYLEPFEKAPKDTIKPKTKK